MSGIFACFAAACYQFFMFLLSKYVWMLIQPLTLVLLALLLAILLKSWAWARGLIVLLLLLGILPIGSYALYKLERIYPVPPLNTADFDGIIVLGGSIDLHTVTKTGQPQLSAYAERFVEAIALARQFPDKTVIFSGGAGSINHPDHTESAQLKILMQKMNIDPQRFVFEDKSRTTYENMRELKSMGIDKKGRYLLVTSGFHIPRAVALFQSHGFDIIPYPAGFMEDDNFKPMPTLNLLGNYIKLNIAVKELLGMIAYKSFGKIL